MIFCGSSGRVSRKEVSVAGAQPKGNEKYHHRGHEEHEERFFAQRRKARKEKHCELGVLGAFVRK